MIRFSGDIASDLSIWISQTPYDHIVFLADDHTATHCGHLLGAIWNKQQALVVPHGESAKTLDTARLVWEFLIEKKATRKSLLINLGGGMVTDLGGFCASVYQRGIDFVNIPTTLLAMADASTGGKTGIDFNHYKNYIGTFSAPKAVFIHTQFLRSLPEEEMKNGWAEVIKHAILAGGDLWEKVHQGIPPQQDSAVWSELISENIAIKSAIVEEDMYEKGRRRILNFGHTIGHALESVALDHGHPQKHGYCVAAGMVAESYIAHRTGLLKEETWLQIESLIDKYFPRFRNLHHQTDELLAYILADKKNSAGKISLSLPQDIGTISIGTEVPLTDILEALKYYFSHGVASES